ncbi:hypothetical protein ABZP36_011420 [Zizania latifolia]
MIHNLVLLLLQHHNKLLLLLQHHEGQHSSIPFFFTISVAHVGRAFSASSVPVASALIAAIPIPPHIIRAFFVPWLRSHVLKMIG